MKILPLNILREQLPFGALLVEQNGHYYVRFK